MPIFEIDGKKITAEQGTTVLEAARANGIEIPHFCYHESFQSGGLCRMCLVEIEKMPKLQTSCTTVVTEGMVVKTTTERVKEARKAILEFILTNHPLDCPDCDQAGECVLQDYTHKYGPDKSSFIEPKELRNHIELSEHIAYDPERCIMCERCVRYYREIVGTEELAVMYRGTSSEITTFPGKQLTYGYIGNIADICPVGALTTRDFRFKERVFNLRTTETICPLCEAGCPIYVDAKMFTVYRVRSRNPKITTIHTHPNRDVAAVYPDPLVNAILRSGFICDDGRFNYKKMIQGIVIDEPVNRIEPKKNAWNELLGFVAEKIKENGHGVSGIISTYATNEEAYAFMHLLKYTGASSIGIINFPEAKEFGRDKQNLKLRKGVQAPNVRGVKEIANWYGIKLIGIEDVLKSKPGLIYILGPVFDQLDKYGDAVAAMPFVIVEDFKSSEWMGKVHVILPGVNFAQKDGTYTNKDGMVQRLKKAVNEPKHSMNDLDILNSIVYNIMGKGLGSFDQVLKTMVDTIPFFKDVKAEELSKELYLKKAAGRLW